MTLSFPISLLLLVFFSSTLLSSCRTRRKVSKISSSEISSSSSVAKKTVPTADTSASAQNSTVSPSDGTQAQSTTCPQASIDLASMPIVPESLSPLFKIYGSTDSSILVVGLPMYQHGSLKSILLTNHGEVLAQKAIIESLDVREDTTLKPIIFENLALKEKPEISLVFQVSCLENSCSSQETWYRFTPEQSSYEDTFLSKPVVNLQSPITEGYFSYYPRPQFIPQNGEGFSDFRSYKIASEKALWKIEGLEKYFITDALGQWVIPPKDASIYVGDDRLWITYYPISDQIFLRTILWLP